MRAQRKTSDMVVLIAGGAVLAAGYVAGRLIAANASSNNFVSAVRGALEPTGTGSALSQDAAQAAAAQESAAQEFWAMDATVTTRADSQLISRSGASWPAILAGAAVIAAMTLVALSLGVGLGMTVVSPWGGSGVSATTFKVGTGIYFIVIAMIASALGGHVTGRLRHRFTGIHDNEVYFRDTIHGFVAWAVALIAGAAFLASAAGGIVGTAAPVAASAASSAAAQDNGPAAGYVDRLLRADTSATTPATASQAENDPRPELVRLFATSIKNKQDLAPADRSYVVQVVARRTGLAPAEAEKRVNDVTAQAKSDLDAARKAMLQLALWLTASLFMGAFAASIAAAEAGAFRDRNWGVRTTA
jgi:hypothetical protein